MEDSTACLEKSNGFIIAKLPLICENVLYELDLRRHLLQCIGKGAIDVELLENFHKIAKLVVQLVLLQSLRIWDNRNIFTLKFLFDEKDVTNSFFSTATKDFSIPDSHAKKLV